MNLDIILQWITLAYQELGIARTPELVDFAVLATLSATTIVAPLLFLTRSKPKTEKEEISLPVQEQMEVREEISQKEEIPASIEKAPITLDDSKWDDRLKKGVGQARESIWKKIYQSFSGQNQAKDEILEQIEEILYTADLGHDVISNLLETIETDLEKGKEINLDDLKHHLMKTLNIQFEEVQSHFSVERFSAATEEKAPKVIMLVGINGAGKTTTTGKLAARFTAEGKKVVVGACDTFRAAAVDQLQVWCDRSQATMVRAKEGAAPSGVAYEALQKAINDKADICLIDTAGRLHNNSQLMDELAKGKKVLQKLLPQAPHEILLVLDAITGQNALRQAQEFHKALQLTGLVLTKCDGSSKAGSAVSIVNSLQVPISFIGVGENVEDLNYFNTEKYLKALLDL